jgi:hypothetical protein
MTQNFIESEEVQMAASEIRAPDSAELRELRKSSVDNLERLYTIVAGLSLTTAVSRLLVDGTGAPVQGALRLANMDFYFESLPMFISLVVTLVPFYHGANRYLFSTYVFIADDKAPRPLTALLDFLFFFSQALIFFAMSLVLRQPSWFFGLLILVLALDCLWLASVYFQYPETWKTVSLWFWLNLGSSFILGLLLATPILPNDGSRYWFATVVCIVRTIIDYGRGWAFYLPGFVREQPGEKA